MRGMLRNEFIKTCGLGCLGIIAGGALLESCMSVKYVTAQINGSFMEVPIDVFVIEKEGKNDFRKYVVLQNEQLQYPISVFRNDNNSFTALYMRCTHQGTELQVFGDRLQCSAHGSEFTRNGEVQNGPADKNLKTFPVSVIDNLLKINLA